MTDAIQAEGGAERAGDEVSVRCSESAQVGTRGAHERASAPKEAQSSRRVALLGRSHRSVQAARPEDGSSPQVGTPAQTPVRREVRRSTVTHGERRGREQGKRGGGGQGRGQTEARNPGRCPTRRTTTWCLRRQGKVSRKRNHKKRKVKYPRAEKAIVEKSGIPDNPRDSSFSRRVGRTPRRGRKARGGRGTDALLKSATG